MNRRTLLKLFGKAVLLTFPWASRISFGTKVEGDSFILIYDALGQDPDLLLEGARKFLTHIHPNWEQKLTTWEMHLDETAIEAFRENYAPHTTELQLPILINVPEVYEGDVRVWTLKWLESQTLSPQTRYYPVSPSEYWWSIEGNLHPTDRQIRQHLYWYIAHFGRFRSWWLNRLNYYELQSLHGDHHWELIGQGRVHWQYVNK